MPKAEDYRLLIEREWADLHHSRIQEWTALGVVAGAHLGLIQLVKLAADATNLDLGTLTILAGLVGVIFSLLGALMTCRHRRLMEVKLGWIYQAEEHLGLIKTDENPMGVIPEDVIMKADFKWRGLSLPRLLSTSGLILCFYAAMFVVDVIVISWSQSI